MDFRTFFQYWSFSNVNIKSNDMNRERALKIMKILDRINQEIDALGKVALPNQLKPAPVRVKNWESFERK